MSEIKFVLGIDLDGVVADFYGCLRPIAAEWLGVPLETLTEDVKYGLKEWGLKSRDEYEDLHRFAVTQRELFRIVKPISGAAPALRRLDATKHVRIRIITHRLYASNLHQIAAKQTTEWLDNYGIPYWDLCFMKEKDKVGASLYIEDSPDNIQALKKARKPVIIFSNSTNLSEPGLRANSWLEVEELVLQELEQWKARKLSEGALRNESLLSLSRGEQKVEK